MATTTLTTLEQTVATALRLSAAATELLLPEIQDNIATAKAELKRSGVNPDMLDEENVLGNKAIVTYCLMQMNDEDKYEQYFQAFQYQQDNLRKSIEDEE